MPATPLDVPNLLCFWDFQEPPGRERVAKGRFSYRLQEKDGPVERVAVNDAPFGPYAAELGRAGWLNLLRPDCPALNLHGPKAQVSLLAWIKRTTSPNRGSCQAVAGMWNEHALRQYCLFLNLRIWDSAEQVGAHISGVGGATPGYKYCMDAAIGTTPVPFNQWQCVAISYDGQFAKAYVNGKLDKRGDRNPYHYPLGIFDGGKDGADFTVGAVARPERVDEDFKPHGSVVANRYFGLLGGLAVYDRALTDDEMLQLATRSK
jgi:hypothetical protein